MYLPFETTSAIFVGGLIKFAVDWVCSRSQLTKDRREKVENSGILLASGLVAGEAITGVVLAGLYLVNITLPKVSQDPILGLLIFPLVMWVLIKLPLVRTKDARG
jgi:uncharacterized oligopeptide transporter (OPT) family protein